MQVPFYYQRCRCSRHYFIGFLSSLSFRRSDHSLSRHGILFLNVAVSTIECQLSCSTRMKHRNSTASYQTQWLPSTYGSVVLGLGAGMLASGSQQQLTTQWRIALPAMWPKNVKRRSATMSKRKRHPWGRRPDFNIRYVTSYNHQPHVNPIQSNVIWWAQEITSACFSNNITLRTN